MRSARPDEPVAAGDGGDDRTYLELARQIQAEVVRLAADPDARDELVLELVEGAPGAERAQLARRIFDALPGEQQWAVLERVYGDEEIAAYLGAARAARLAEVRALGEQRQRATRARAEHRFDTADVGAGYLLTLGLFREPDVRGALARGETSSACARRVVLRAVGDGTFQVIEDVFNPAGGYFVTAEYSEDTWRRERLASHAIVRVGSLVERPRGPVFEPVLHPGARVDVEIGGQAARGQLHLGFATLSGVGIFAD